MMRLMSYSSAVVAFDSRQYRPKTSATVGGDCGGFGRMVAINGQPQSSIENRRIGIPSIKAVGFRFIRVGHGSETAER